MSRRRSILHGDRPHQDGTVFPPFGSSQQPFSVRASESDEVTREDPYPNDNIDLHQASSSSAVVDAVRRELQESYGSAEERRLRFLQLTSGNDNPTSLSQYLQHRREQVQVNAAGSSSSAVAPASGAARGAIPRSVPAHDDGEPSSMSVLNSARRRGKAGRAQETTPRVSRDGDGEHRTTTGTSTTYTTL